MLLPRGSAARECTEGRAGSKTQASRREKEHPTDVRFYHLTRTRLEDALPVMLGRTLERGGRAVVRLATPARLKALDEWLWTFDHAAFIPHGSEGGSTRPTSRCG